MNASERIGNLIAGKPIDRLPVIEWAPWWGLTVERWKSEGVPAEVCGSVYDLQNYFGLDKCIQTRVSPFSKSTPRSRGEGLGIMDDEEDYERVKPTLFPAPETNSRISDERFAWIKKTHDDGDTVHFFTVNGSFWYPRELFGIENHLFSFYDYPELYKRIIDDYADYLEKVFNYVFTRFRFDFMTFEEDMSYNNGPMLSKELFDEFLAPFYKRLIPLIHSYNVPVIIDSDGDITLAVDWYASVGADGMLPLERQAGVDVSLYIKKQPNLTFIGHFDKMCMKFGEEAMRKEFERLLPSCKAGKVIMAVDHQTPPDVSVENYRTYVRLFKEYAAKVQK